MLSNNDFNIIPIGIYGRYANESGGCSCYLVCKGDYKFLLDFGSGSFGELRKHVDCKELKAIILSHLHYDHIADALPFAYFLAHNNIVKMPIYLPVEPTGVSELFSKSVYDIMPCGGTFYLGEIIVEMIKCTHPSTSVVMDSYMIKLTDGDVKVLYTADCAIAEEVHNASLDCSVVIGDACVLDKDYSAKSPHLSVKQLAGSVPCNCQLYLTHLTEGEEQLALQEAELYHAKSKLAIIGEKIVVLH